MQCSCICLCKEEADVHDFVLEIGQFGTEQEKGPFLKFIESESADKLLLFLFLQHMHE